MRILILTYGSRGDVQPFEALGKGLTHAGHDVTLATSARFADFVTAQGLGFAPMNDDLLALLDTDQGRDLIENTNNLFQVVKRSFQMMRQVRPTQHALLREGWAAAEAMQPDIIVFHPKSYGGLFYAEKLGIPAVLALPIPMMVPTATRPNLGFPKLKLGGWYNRMTYRLVTWLTGLSAKGPVNAWRAANGLPALKRFRLLHDAAGAPVPVLHPISRYVMPEPKDWPPSAHMTGYWFLDEAEDWSPPPALEAFLKAGPAPVYIGFGSMAGRDPGRLGRIVVEALRRTNLRAVIATGWGGLKADSLPETVLQIEQAPHDWLFPQLAAIVHHGGAGTTAAALRAGKPSVIIPFFGDQPFWGCQMQALGVSAAPIPQKTLTADNLAAALHQVTGDEEMARKTKALAKKIRREDGVAKAVSLIEAAASA
ncbi:glycosyltransferase [Methyloligella sp. 2.7D]|uniref:glycosyltransferase n=1 Tax=unclassified Methyloligella TaxID=2625955 RepID=UPI00157E03D8|nr:glycosyltransferase [Methyloligella sp. GL2]QKP77915.1 glycosyltransferase family 1 protein [Methyloligella sp. GL2]